MDLMQMFIAYLKEKVKNHCIYVWGANGERVPTITESWIRKKETSEDNTQRALKYFKKQIAAGYEKILQAFDCSGLISKFLQENGFVTSKRNCNHLATMCTKVYDRSEGTVLQIGDLVFRWNSSNKYYHVGVYIGDNKVIESKGRDDGVVERDINASGKTYWNRYGRLKIFENVTSSKPDTTTTIPGSTLPKLKLTDPYTKNSDVKELQKLLIDAGIKSVVINKEVKTVSIDGSFGPITDAAVRMYQKMKGLTVDGIVGVKTWASLKG